MKKLVLVAALVLSFVLVACGNAQKSNSMGKGKTMILTFVTSPTTGFDWEYSFDGDAIVELDHEEYQMDNNKELIGAPGTRVYYFTAKKEGKTNLTFMYRRPWEGGEKAYDVVYELSVDKSLNITCWSKMKGEIESEKELKDFPNPEFTE